MGQGDGLDHRFQDVQIILVFRAGVEVVEIKQEELGQIEDDPDIEVRLPCTPVQEEFILEPVW